MEQFMNVFQIFGINPIPIMIVAILVESLKKSNLFLLPDILWERKILKLNLMVTRGLIYIIFSFIFSCGVSIFFSPKLTPYHFMKTALTTWAFSGIGFQFVKNFCKSKN